MTAGDYDAGSMHTLFRIAVDDKVTGETGNRFPDSTVNILLNTAARDVFNRLQNFGISQLTAEESVTILADTQEIATSVSLSKVNHVRRNETNNKNPIEVVDEYAARRSTVPVVYIRNLETTLLGYYIEVSTDTKFTINYTADFQSSLFSEDTFTSSDNITIIADNYKNVIVSRAAMLGLASDSDKRTYWELIYNDQMSDIVSLITPKLRQVVDVYEDHHFGHHHHHGHH